ncbi:MAG: hypothetical protein R2705_06575 [Ilumatobacteraceae bacterium]
MPGSISRSASPPALSGLNTVTITVDKPATGLVTLVVQFDPIDQYVESIVIEAPTTLTGRGELVVEDVPFNAPGRWKVTVTGTGTDGSLGTLESEFTLAPGTTVTTAGQSTVPATPSTVTSVVDDAGAETRFGAHSLRNSSSNTTGSATSSWS